MSQKENINVKKVGNVVFKNIHKNTDEHTLSEIINRKITNLIIKDLSKGVLVCRNIPIGN